MLNKIKKAKKVADTIGYKNTYKLARKYMKLKKALKKRPRRK